MKKGLALGAIMMAFAGPASANTYNIDGAREPIPNGANPIVSMKNPNGEHKCTGLVVGPNIVVTPHHCDVKEPSSFQTTDREGRKITTNKAEILLTGRGWALDKEIPAITSDPYHQEILTDISIIKTDTNIDAKAMPIVPLDALKWEATADPEIRRTPVEMLVRWSFKSGDPDFVGAFPCYLYKKNGVSSALAHDCETEPGVSGGTFAIKFDSRTYAAVAIHAGHEPPKYKKGDSPLIDAFKRVLPKIPLHVATPLQQVAGLCKQKIKNCQVKGDSMMFTIEMTGP